VPSPENRRKVNVKSFAHDFVSGASDAELRDKFALSQSDLARLVAKLKNEGFLVPEDVSNREDNLKIRFGSPKGPPDPVTTGGAPVDLDTGVVIHCPGCGAAVTRGASNCGYCKAPLDFNLKGKTVPCPHCFATNPAECRFCVKCGKPVKGLIEDGKVMEDRVCPRCRKPMQGKQVGEFSVIECLQCGGFFVPNDVFDMMQENSHRVIFPANGIPKAQMDPTEAVRYVRCPICRQMMNRMNFARVSGVILDICKPHGIWFDAGELEKIMDFIARGGMQRARQREIEELKADEDRARIRSIPIGPRESESTYWGHTNNTRELFDLGEAVVDFFRILKK
jgi:Zn-finger nucleic acid-binding protein